MGRVRITLAATALVALLLATSAHAAFPGRDGFIAFTATAEHPDCEDWEKVCAEISSIYRMTPAGLRVKRLAYDAESPSWSPGGTKIAFSRAGTLWVMNADGTRPRSLGVQGHSPAWAPDGRRLVFGAAGYKGRRGIAVVKADGSSGRFLTESDDDGNPDWSPDGRRITFARYGTTHSHLMTISAGGRGLRTLIRRCACGGADHSPDGRAIAYTRAGEIWLAGRDGSERRRLTRETESGPVWSPSGRQLAFFVYPRIFTISRGGTDKAAVGPGEDQLEPRDSIIDFTEIAWQPGPRR